MKKILILCLILSCLLLVLGGCIQLERPPESTGNTPAGSITHYYLNMQYNYSTLVDEEILTTGLDSRYLLLANKISPMGETYVPEDLVNLTSPTYMGKEVQLNRKASQALDAMLAEMRADGVEGTSVTSAYRSYAYQTSLFNQYLINEQKGISTDAYNALGADYIKEHYTDKGISALNAADARRVVLTYSAAPGTSEHQTGLCVDFMTLEMNGQLTTAFENTAAFAWLRDNAFRFGFILRYPKGKENITGYTYEPWHFRFVGREAATDIHFGGLTLEEYLGK